MGGHLGICGIQHAPGVCFGPELALWYSTWIGNTLDDLACFILLVRYTVPLIKDASHRSIYRSIFPQFAINTALR